MECNLKDCYWNMWTPNHPLFSGEDSKVCISEDLREHYDENDEFEMLPNSPKCPGYRPYREFCGVEKGESLR